MSNAATESYRPLPRGAQVVFANRASYPLATCFQIGAPRQGKIVAVHLDPNRRPGVGRVAYDVVFHAAYAAIRIPAALVTAV